MLAWLAPTGSSARLGASGCGSAGSDQGLGRVSVVGCPIRPLSGPEGPSGKSEPLGLDTVVDGKSLSSYAVSLGNRGSRASTCLHARYRAPLEDGTVSCMSPVPFWPGLTKVLGWYSAICLPVRGRLSRPIHHSGIEHSDLALHIRDADVWQKS